MLNDYTTKIQRKNKNATILIKINEINCVEYQHFIKIAIYFIRKSKKIGKKKEAFLSFYVKVYFMLINKNLFLIIKKNMPGAIIYIYISIII